MKSKREELERALSGSVRPHHRFMLSSLLRQYEFLSEEIAALDLEVAERMRPYLWGRMVSNPLALRARGS